jgi:hypothetical protein
MIKTANLPKPAIHQNPMEVWAKGTNIAVRVRLASITGLLQLIKVGPELWSPQLGVAWMGRRDYQIAAR